MARTILERGLTNCPVCGEQKQRLSRHWSYCAWPEISDADRNLLEGILLGGGSIQGTSEAKHLVIRTTNERFARWLFERLGWLAHSLRRVERDSGRKPRYEIRTHGHRKFGDLRDQWYDDDQKDVRTAIDLSAASARIWYAMAGSLEWAGDADSQFRICFPATDENRAKAIHRVLDQTGVDCTRETARVTLSSTTAREWVAWTAPPPPGQAYKWCLDRDLYIEAREEPILPNTTDAVEIHRRLLQFVAAVHGTVPTHEDVSEALTGSVADDISSTLGGGTWDAALRVARVTGDDWKQSPPTTGGPRGRPREYDRDDLRAAIRAAAREMSEPLSQEKYRTWRDRTDRDVPALETFAYQSYARYNSWHEACADAGVEPATDDGSKQWTRDELREWLETAVDDLGTPLTTTAYDEWSRESPAPSLSLYYQRYGSWGEAKADVDIE